MKHTTLMFNRKTRVRSAAVVLVILQSVASYGYAQADDTDEYIEEITVYGYPTVAPGAEISQQIRAEIKATVADLNADTKARLGEHIRLSTREQLAAAAPTNDAATKPLQATVRNRLADDPQVQESSDSPI